MADDDIDNIGFGSIVNATINGHSVRGEVVGGWEDNRDLDEFTYILAIGGDLRQYDGVSSEEIVSKEQIDEVLEQ